MSGFISGGTSSTVTTDGYQGLAQTIFVELIEDGYTIARDPNFSTLLSQAIITSGGNLVISFSASFGANTSLKEAMFRLLIDGSVYRVVGSGYDSAHITQAVAIILHTPITADAHTISVEWGKSKLDQKLTSLYILAGTETNGYHASLLIQEVE